MPKTNTASPLCQVFFKFWTSPCQRQIQPLLCVRSFLVLDFAMPKTNTASPLCQVFFKFWTSPCQRQIQPLLCVRSFLVLDFAMPKTNTASPLCQVFFSSGLRHAKDSGMYWMSRVLKLKMVETDTETGTSEMPFLFVPCRTVIPTVYARIRGTTPFRVYALTDLLTCISIASWRTMW